MANRWEPTERELLFVPCTCDTAYHFLRVSEDMDRDAYLYVEFVSTRNGSIWHRIKWALKHVFGREDLVYADIIIKRSDLRAALKEEEVRG